MTKKREAVQAPAPTPAPISAETRWAIWDHIQEQLEKATTEKQRLETQVSDQGKWIKHLKKLAKALVDFPCPSCDGRGWNYEYDHLDSRSQEPCGRCKGAREAPRYDHEKEV